MRVLIINAVCGIRSTGRICIDIAERFEQDGHEVKIAYGREDVPEEYKKYAVLIGSIYEVYWHALMSKVFDARGYWSIAGTKKFLKWANEFDPDLVWLHNLHDYFINTSELFKWIKSRPKMTVKWTQHDCWSFTGGCSHFSAAKCYQWKTGCTNCSSRGKFPRAPLFINSRKNFQIKKRDFTGVNNMTLITPSKWLKDLVNESFLKCYPVEVNYNNIDRQIFKPTNSDFRDKYDLLNKHIVLGVASNWTEKKGLFEFYRLAKELDETYVIVLVGLTDRQYKRLPKNIIGIKRTNSREELAEIYSSADVFVNLSKEETFGLTTVEAEACGTTAIVYENTACEEIVGIYGGVVIEQDNFEQLLNEIRRICTSQH